ncbi:O-antigen ligase family protein [Nevskia sp.]|uniref:O-antigen ligase family protein n=1 Tax=Nevskia sp. TaxID=1929292 RepID=UPI0025EBEC96|nr:O-antigen ligase family protein [Nevskia sp.]
MQNSLNKITLTCLLGASFFLGLNAIRVIEFITLGDVFLFAAAGISIIQVVTGQRTTILQPGIPFSLSLLFFTMALGLSIGNNEGISVSNNVAEYVKVFLGLFFVPYLYANLIRDEKWLVLMIRAFVLSIIVSVCVGLTEFIGYEIADSIGAVTITGESFLSTGRARGLTLHPNFLALISAVALPLAWVLPSRGFSSRLWKAITIAVCVIGVLAGGSRAALIAVMFIGFICFLFSTTVRQKISTVVSICLGLIITIFAVQGTVVEEYLVAIVALKRLIDGLNGESAVTDSDDERLGFLTVAADNIDLFPLSGAGFEWIQHAHNIYIQVFEAAGILGALAFAFYLLGFVSLFPRTKHPKGGRRLLIGCGLSVAVYLISGLAANSLYTRPIILPFAFLWVAAICDRRKILHERRECLDSRLNRLNDRRRDESQLV